MKPFSWVDDLFVLSEVRGFSIGSNLIAAAKTYALKNDCSNLMVGVGNDEVASEKFYLKNDFFDMKCKLMSLPL